jgi:CRISPR-associated endoribonuclease Cas6
MRFKLHLKPVRDRQKLLFNYQYPLQAWLYKLIYQADQDYASFLHNQGYAVPNSYKTFKHFTFSSLQITKSKPIRKGDTYIQLSSDNITLIVSFYIDKAAEGFIIGLFQNQEMSLYNRELQADFIVERVETLENSFDLYQKNEVITKCFKTISPMVVARKEGSLDKYLSPTDEGFSAFFALNLIDRFRTLQGTEGMQMDATFAKNIVKFKLQSDPERIKMRGFTVKEGKLSQQTKVIGYYNFSFEVTAPAQLLEIGYLGGFGKESSMGCGSTDVLAD